MEHTKGSKNLTGWTKDRTLQRKDPY